MLNFKKRPKEDMNRKTSKSYSIEIDPNLGGHWSKEVMSSQHKRPRHTHCFVSNRQTRLSEWLPNSNYSIVLGKESKWFPKIGKSALSKGIRRKLLRLKRKSSWSSKFRDKRLLLKSYSKKSSWKSSRKSFKLSSMTSKALSSWRKNCRKRSNADRSKSWAESKKSTSVARCSEKGVSSESNVRACSMWCKK